jgi:hypothetical protein
MMAQHLDAVVARVTRQDSSWPRDRVRRYAQYILETVSGIDLNPNEAI